MTRFSIVMNNIEAKSVLAAGVIAAALISILRAVLSAVNIGNIQVTTDIQGLIAAATSGNIMAFLLTLVGIAMLGLVVLVTPRILDEVL